MGGGDVRLMAAAGLLLGLKNIVLSLVLGCLLASVLHVLYMKLKNKDHMLAFGPYLSMGIFISMIYGNQIIEWYVNTFVN